MLKSNHLNCCLLCKFNYYIGESMTTIEMFSNLQLLIVVEVLK